MKNFYPIAEERVSELIRLLGYALQHADSETMQERIIYSLESLKAARFYHPVIPSDK